jgi:uncharacterized protein (TIGR02145 family)
MQLKILNRLILVFIMLLSSFIQGCKKGDKTEGDSTPCTYSKQDVGPMILSLSPANGAFVGTSTTLSWKSIAFADRNVINTVYFGPGQSEMSVIASQTEDSILIKDLIAGKTYYWTIIATETYKCGRSKGAQKMSFTVVLNNDIPVVSTNTISIVHLNTTAPAGGNVLYGGSSPVSERGIYYGTERDPEKKGTKIQIGNGLGSYSTLVSGLVSLTDYYIKAYAINSSATVYGQEITFNSGEPTVFKTINDIEGNTYKDISIGTQTWFAENLKTSRLNDGTSIPLVTDNSTWVSLITPGYCYMNNDYVTYRDKYGALYNGWTVKTGKICPVGWHVPTDEDWSALETYLGGSDLAVQLKSLTGWDSDPYGINGYNTSGFSAYPGGNRSNDFFSKGYFGYWWITSSQGLQYRSLIYNYNTTVKERVYDFQQYVGYSIRCIKD